MVQTEKIGKFDPPSPALGQVETHTSPAKIIPTSGTELREEIEREKTSWLIVSKEEAQRRSSDDFNIRKWFAKVVDTTSCAETSERDGSKEELQNAINIARCNGLTGIANRLIELKNQPLSEDEESLQYVSVKNFVRYCISRNKRQRPLITATPAGEIDATWKGPKSERVVMRFFATGKVWVAYKLLKEEGSFEIAAKDLSASDLHFKIPEWA